MCLFLKNPWKNLFIDFFPSLLDFDTFADAQVELPLLNANEPLYGKRISFQCICSQVLPEMEIWKRVDLVIADRFKAKRPSGQARMLTLKFQEG